MTHPIDAYPFLSEHVGPQGMYMQIKCSRCDVTDSRRNKSKNMSIENIHLPYWRHKGWTFVKNEAICVRCRDKAHRKQKGTLTATIGDTMAAKLAVVEVEPEIVSPLPKLSVVETPPVPTPISKQELLKRMAERKQPASPAPPTPPPVERSRTQQGVSQRRLDFGLGEPPIAKNREGLTFAEARDAFDEEVLAVLRKSRTWMHSPDIQAITGGLLQQVRNSLHRLIEDGRVLTRGQTRTTQYKIGVEKPPTVVVPTPAPVEAAPAKPMRYHSPEFKRFVVEKAHDLPRGAREDFFREQGIHPGGITYFKRDYIEGKLGTLEKPVKINPLHNEFQILRTRKFTDNYKRTLVNDASKIKERDIPEFLRVRGLNVRHLFSWRREFGLYGDAKPATASPQPAQPIKPTSAPAPASQTNMDTKIQFQLYDLLRERCPNGRYVPGWNDTNCAKKLGLTDADVEKLRVEIYGNPVDPAVAELKEDLVVLKKKFDEDMKGLRELEKSIRDDFQRQFDGLSDRLVAIEAR